MLIKSRPFPGMVGGIFIYKRYSTITTDNIGGKERLSFDLVVLSLAEVYHMQKHDSRKYQELYTLSFWYSLSRSLRES